MDISPQLLRDAEFREQRRGYSPSEVDEFLERVATGVGQLQQQLQDAVTRADEAERRPSSTAADEEGIKRTLVLAQRTADAALEEARQQAATTIAEAEERAAQLVAGAEERAAATERAADERAATVVSQAEGRVATELVPLLEQRDVVQRDVEALQGWAAEVRSRLADDMRQHLAWLEGGVADVPARPEVLDLTLPAEVQPAPGGDGGRPLDEVVDGAGPEDDGPLGAQADGGAAEPDATGVGQAAVGGDRPDRVDHGDHGVEGGPLATAAADDPFLAELRRAVTDDEPLGPRDAVDVDTDLHGDADDPASSMFRRRKRR